MNNLSYVVQQVRSNCLVEFAQREFSRKQTAEGIEDLMEQKKKAYQGEMSRKAQKSIIKRVHVWHNAIKAHNATLNRNQKKYFKKLVFITLTLSDNQFTSDKQVKSKMLRPFLRVLVERYNATHYIWKAEAQKNGRIHFHILTDTYISKLDLTEEWNKIQLANNYLSAINLTNQGKQPTSTFIEAMNDDGILSSYLAKYIAKESDSRKIDGAVWKCSTKLISLSYYSYIVDNEQDAKVRKLEAKQSLTRKDAEECFILLFNNVTLRDILTNYNYNEMWTYYRLVYDFLYGDSDIVEFNLYAMTKKRDPFTDKNEAIRLELKEIIRKQPEQLDLFAAGYSYNSDL